MFDSKVILYSITRGAIPHLILKSCQATDQSAILVYAMLLSVFFALFYFTFENFTLSCYYILCKSVRKKGNSDENGCFLLTKKPKTFTVCISQSDVQIEYKCSKKKCICSKKEKLDSQNDLRCFLK